MAAEVPEFKPRPGQIDFTHIKRAPVINCLVEYNGKILLVQRNEKMRFYPGAWNGISGFLDEPDKSIKDKVHEEMREELGLREDAILKIIEGKVTERDEPAYDKTWIIHPVRVVVATDQITLDWEAQNFTWVDPKDIKNYKTMPGFIEDVVTALYP